MILLYPLEKLMNKELKELTPNFKTSIIRIFKILDKDKDGWL